MVPDTEYAWIAGFMDGEGCWSHTARTGTIRGRGQLKMTAAQNHIYPLERIQKVFGGSIYYIQRKGFLRDGVTPKRAVYHYYLGGRPMIEATKKLWPYLCPVKKRQFNACIIKFKESTKSSADGYRETRV